MTNVREIDISQMDSTIKHHLSASIPSDEKVLMLCWGDDSVIPSLYVLTDHCAARLTIRERPKALINKLTGDVTDTSILVYFKDIISVQEYEWGRFLLSPPSIAISLYAQDQNQAVLGFGFAKRDEVFIKFSKTIRALWENCRNSKEQNTSTQKQGSVVDRLIELDQLLKSGLISQLEYDQKRVSIIGEL